MHVTSECVRPMRLGHTTRANIVPHLLLLPASFDRQLSTPYGVRVRDDQNDHDHWRSRSRPNEEGDRARQQCRGIEGSSSPFAQGLPSSTATCGNLNTRDRSASADLETRPSVRRASAVCSQFIICFDIHTRISPISFQTAWPDKTILLTSLQS